MKAARPATKGDSFPMIFPASVIVSPGLAVVRAVWIDCAVPVGAVARTLESSALGAVFAAVGTAAGSDFFSQDASRHKAASVTMVFMVVEVFGSG